MRLKAMILDNWDQWEGFYDYLPQLSAPKPG